MHPVGQNQLMSKSSDKSMAWVSSGDYWDSFALPVMDWLVNWTAGRQTRPMIWGRSRTQTELYPLISEILNGAASKHWGF
jgi:hypothetical protein